MPQLSLAISPHCPISYPSLSKIPPLLQGSSQSFLSPKGRQRLSPMERVFSRYLKRRPLSSSFSSTRKMINEFVRWVLFREEIPVHFLNWLCGIRLVLNTTIFIIWNRKAFLPSLAKRYLMLTWPLILPLGSLWRNLSGGAQIPEITFSNSWILFDGRLWLEYDYENKRL